MRFEIALRHTVGRRDIALDIASDARLLALVGSSGAGKTTVLDCIAGLVTPRSGRIEIGGDLLFDSASKTNLPPELRRTGYVFQDTRLFPHLKVDANLAYGERRAGPDRRWPDRDEIVALLDIGHLLDRWPQKLSGGEARRVAIGRALLSAPRFLLLDEPLTSLDSERADRIAGMIERIRDDLAIPILLVSHDHAEVARLADEVVILS